MAKKKNVFLLVFSLKYLFLFLKKKEEDDVLFFRVFCVFFDCCQKNRKR